MPVYNESDYIDRVIHSLYKLIFPKFIHSFELIIVDDASQDNSVELIYKIINHYPDIQLIRHKYNKGKGAAVQTALTHASGDLFIVQDADLELSPQDIPIMLDFFYSHNLILLNGSRFMNNYRHKDNTFLRNLANKIFSFIASVLSGKNITDLTCGYKLFSQSLLENIKLQENRFGIETELLIKALRYDKHKVMEIPIRYIPREVSAGKKIRAIDGFSILWTIFKYSLF